MPYLKTVLTTLLATLLAVTVFAAPCKDGCPITACAEKSCEDCACPAKAKSCECDPCKCEDCQCASTCKKTSTCKKACKEPCKKACQQTTAQACPKGTASCALTSKTCPTLKACPIAEAKTPACTSCPLMGTEACPKTSKSTLTAEELAEIMGVKVWKHRLEGLKGDETVKIEVIHHKQLMDGSWNSRSLAGSYSKTVHQNDSEAIVALYNDNNTLYMAVDGFGNRVDMPNFVGELSFYTGMIDTSFGKNIIAAYSRRNNATHFYSITSLDDAAEYIEIVHEVVKED